MNTLFNRVRGSFILQTLLLTFLVLALFGPAEPADLDGGGELVFPAHLAQSVGAEVLGAGF